MRHRKANVKLGRTASHRKMMLRNMVTSLFDNYLIDEQREKARVDKLTAAKGLTVDDPNAVQPRKRVNRMTTTVDKAKALRPLVDKVILLARKGDDASFRRLEGIFTKGSVVQDLMTAVKERDEFAGRDYGFMSYGRVSLRAGDAAVLCAVSLIGRDYQQASTTKDAVRSTADRRKRVAASQKRQAGLDAAKAAQQ
jgi:large subunit ribosomal protein L17